MSNLQSGPVTRSVRVFNLYTIWLWSKWTKSHESIFHEQINIHNIRYPSVLISHLILYKMEKIKIYFFTFKSGMVIEQCELFFIFFNPISIRQDLPSNRERLKGISTFLVPSEQKSSPYRTEFYTPEMVVLEVNADNILVFLLFVSRTTDSVVTDKNIKCKLLWL